MAESERRLVAILFTDIVGYTSLVGADEAKGIEAREEHRHLIQTLAAQFHGEYVDESGDAALAIFPSAVDAVKCAMAIQAVLAAEPRIQVRAGIHVGDVIERDGRLIGDGINVASRLPSLARPGGIVATDQVVEHLRNQNIESRPLGAKELKNVSHPVPIFAIGGAIPAAPKRARTARARTLGITAGVAIALLLVWLFLLGGKDELLHRAFWSGWLSAPESTPFEQEIGFTNASDGVRIAFATAGNPDGPPVVMVLGWATHLEELARLGANPWIRGILGANRIVLYDGRGSGLSDRHIDDFSLDAKVRDLEAVVDATGLDRFGIIAVSAGGPTTIAYTVRHPERVDRIAFYGSFLYIGGSPENRALWESFPPLVRASWGRDNPAFRELFTNLFYPDADELTKRIFNDFQRLSMTPDDAARFIQSLLATDVREIAPRIDVPTLVIHRRGDQVVPYELGREIAARIPGARLAGLDGNNHAPTPDEVEARQELDALISGFFAERTPIAQP